MFRVIHPNRWFIWTLVLLIVASFMLLFLIQSYLLELEREILESNSVSISSSKTYRSLSLGLLVKYPRSWQVEVSQFEPSFSLQNPDDFNENIVFQIGDLKLESVIRDSINIDSEKDIVIDQRPGKWIFGADKRDSATSNLVLLRKADKLYYIGGQARAFEKIIQSVKFLP